MIIVYLHNFIQHIILYTEIKFLAQLHTSYGMCTGNSLFPHSHGFKIIEFLIFMQASIHLSLCNKTSKVSMQYLNIYYRKVNVIVLH
jgi:hypothetical protein